MFSNFPPCSLPKGSTVWAYLRDSGGDTQDLASQRAYLFAYCEHHELQLKRVFEDAALKGGSVAGRDEFELMVDMARRSKELMVEGIIFWDIKRFARDQLDSQYFKADLRRRGYILLSLSDNIPDNTFATVIEAFLEWKAEQDLLDISKDSRRGLALIVGQRDEKGNYLGICPGKPPKCFKGEKYDLGITRNDGRQRVVQRWVPDPVIWEQGQRAWEMRAEKASYREIEEETRLYPDAINHRSSYNCFFKNEIYIGRLNYGGRVYENFVPALTTVENWEKVQEMRFRRMKKGERQSRGEVHPNTGRNRNYLLSGLCRCMYCDSAIYGNVNIRRDRDTFWRYYLCSRRKARPDSCENKQISAEKLERSTIELICGQVLTMDFVGDLVEQVNELLSDTDGIRGDIERARGKLRELNKAINNLLDMAEKHPSEDLMSRLGQRESERDAKQRELERLERQVSQNSFLVDERVIATTLADMRATLEAGEMKARQYILRQCVEKIEVGRDIARLHAKAPANIMGRDACFWYMPPTGIEPKSRRVTPRCAPIYNYDVV